jgi:hypothetical protein
MSLSFENPTANATEIVRVVQFTNHVRPVKIMYLTHICQKICQNHPWGVEIVVAELNRDPEQSS